MSDAPPHFVDNFIDAERLRRWPRERPGDDAPLPIRFSLLALFAISTGSAIYCGLLRLLGVYGVMLMLAGLIGVHFVRLSGRKRAIKRVVVDMLAGIVLPMGCLTLDPGVFRSNGVSGFFSLADQMFIYTLLGCEMLVLAIWLLVGGAFNDFGRSMTAGVLTLGSLICVALGMVLGMVGLGIVVLFQEPIGLLGFVPWFTLVTFLANARRARTPSGGHRAVVAGLPLGVVLPLALATAVGVGTWLVAPHAPGIPGAKVFPWQESLIPGK